MVQLSRDWRRWVGGVGFLLAVGFLASRGCRAESESASVEIRFEVGAAGSALRRLEVELFRPGEEELLGFYKQSYEKGVTGRAARWPLRADAGVYRLEVTLGTASRTVEVERAIEIQEGATITVNLEPDLAR